MSQKIMRATKDRIEWLAHTRLFGKNSLIILLLAQFAGLLVVAIHLQSAYRQGNPGSLAFLGEVSIGVLIVSAILVFCSGMTVGILLLYAGTKRFTDRLSHVTSLIEGQIADGQFDVELPADPGDEIGRLVRALDKLGHAYRASLQRYTQRAEEMAMLNLVAETINRTLDLQQVFDTSLREALKTVNWDMGAIYMWDERISSLNMVSYVGLSEDVVREEISYELGEGVTGKAAQTGEIIVVDDVAQHADVTQRKGIDLPQTQISIPLVTVPGQLLGVLNVANSEKKVPTQDELNLLKTVAHQIALAIDKAQLYTAASMRADELEGIVEARTEQLAQAIDELSHALEKARETDKLKSLLLSTVSHELRTPLATIKGNTSMLVEHHQQIDPETLKEHLSDIEAETDKLTGLITDLLEMSRIESGMLHIQPQPFDLADTLRSAINAAQVRLGSHVVSMAASDGLVPCYGDARRVEQIVDNLLENAAKYSPEGSPIDVHVEGRGEELVVSVTDKGEGIAPEHLEYIFDRFYQVRRSRDAGRGGIGLGLAICRGLVEAHGGKIWVESTPGKGSTFFFSLPTATAQALSSEGRE